MEHEPPYSLARCPRRDRYEVQQMDRYKVQRNCDGSFAGYVVHLEAGGWEIDDKVEGSAATWNVADEASKHRVFATCNEAALLVSMRNRAYQWFVSVKVPPERIEIKVTPNLDRSSGYYGQWVASLFKEDGTPAGSCCSDLLEEAKFKGLALAHYMTDPKPAEEMRRISKELWNDIPVIEVS